MQKSSSIDKESDQCFVRNSSFLSRDIEAQKAKEVGKNTPPKVISPPKTASPPKVVSPPKKESPQKSASPKNLTSSPPVAVVKANKADIKTNDNSVAAKASKIEAAAQSSTEVSSPPPPSTKFSRSNSRDNSSAPKVPKRENSLNKDLPALPVKTELSLVVENEKSIDNSKNESDNVPAGAEVKDTKDKSEESNGVGDKIKKFEKAAEDASTSGKLSRPGSVRGRPRTERLGSDGKDDFPPPATPFKDNVHFELGPVDKVEKHIPERQQSVTKNAAKWQRSESHEEKIQKPEPQKIIKPEFKPMPSPVDVTIRSPSVGAKAPDQFPSHGTAFRNVASPDQARNLHKFNEDVNTQNNFKPCKLKKEKYSISKGSSYFTRGSEEIWLVKKKDIEEIEERVLDSFRRAGGNICMRSESMRPSSDSGQGASFSSATMGRTKRQMYARSESLDPQWAGTRAQTLKRQTSVACTCGHDKKTRAKSAETARPRSRSHGDDNQAVLDKYETLV